MKYNVRVRKRANNMKVYTIVKKTGAQDNFITKLFMKVFAKGSKGSHSNQ
jgi:hypothetical protein